MIGAGVCAAETDEEATFLRSSQVQAFARLRSGTPGKLPAPVMELDSVVPRHIQAQVEQALACSATGSVKTVRKKLEALIDQYKPDELMVTGMIHDHDARMRSFEIAAEALSDLCEQQVAA